MAKIPGSVDILDAANVLQVQLKLVDVLGLAFPWQVRAGRGNCRSPKVGNPIASVPQRNV